MSPSLEEQRNGSVTTGVGLMNASVSNEVANDLKLSTIPENHDPFQPYKVEKFDEGLRYDTLQIHGGHRPDKETHARAVPIYNSVV